MSNLKFCSDCKVFKPLDNFYTSKAKKCKYLAWCKSCRKVYRYEYCELNRERLTQYSRQHYQDNIEFYLAYAAEYRKNNPDKTKAACLKYTKQNPDKRSFWEAKRKAAKLQRTPKWLTESDWIEIEWAYSEAHRLTKETGVLHTVDHIIPLQGKEISGLHCPQNLQILTISDNSSKGNRWWEQ